MKKISKYALCLIRISRIWAEYEIILASGNETFKEIAARGDLLIILFLLFHLSCIT